MVLLDLTEIREASDQKTYPSAILLIFKPCEWSEWQWDDVWSEYRLTWSDERWTNDVRSECSLAWNGEFPFHDGWGEGHADDQYREDGGH